VAAWVVAVVSVVALVAARPPVDANLWFFVVDVTVACVYGTVAGVVLSRRQHAVPWILAVTALGGALAAFGFAYGTLAFPGMELPAVGAISALQGIAWVPGTLALFLVVPWLVRDHELGWSRWGVAVGTTVSLGFAAIRIVWPSAPMEPMSAAVVVVGLAAAVDAAWRRLRGPVDERPGLAWLAAGTAVMALSFVPLAVSIPWLPFWFTPVLHLAAQAVFPAAILVAVLRQRMWGLDLAVSRATVGGLLTLGLIALYVAVTSAVTAFVPGSGSAQLVAAAAVAAAVQPSRLWLQRHVHRLVHGDGAEPERAVRRLGFQLGSARTPDELLAGLVQNVVAALRLESATLVVDGSVAAVSGAASSEPVQVPLVHRGEQVGLLEVTAPAGEWLGARAVKSLQEMASVVAAGVALARASSDLEEARDRLTSARLEERRVIRRELHDGLGPSLAGIRLGLQGARNLVDRDPEAAAELLATLQAELDQRVDDVRSLSRHLLPPVLDELGLHAALEDLATRQADSGLDVQLHCEPVDLDAPLAGAVYGIVAEAITNVARHAAASQCLVQVVLTDEGLSVLVDDDGSGISPTAVLGVGSSSMRERAEEQGGWLRVVALEPRGTRVEAFFPVALA
jgi:signal transduction histidine kinase